ncbi:MAG: DUF1289 domain-containing protein [Gammaproteobacteria bacterium]|nr:DUF1289 domain-containing protein [Gammaproteobacteria bacterium]HXK56226.1 DUF1289 domain-containing protein [Gammaproteobacteria bacterium]
MKFSPCRGGDFCTREGAHCDGCGRSQQEIAETSELVAAVVRYALDMGYENIEEFTAFIGDKAAKKARKAALELAGGGIGVDLRIGR